MSESKVKKFVKEHKKEIIIVCSATAAVGLACVGIKYIPKIKASNISAAVETGVDFATVAVDKPTKPLLSNLTGESLTPSKLGNVMLQSAQQINKRLEKAGLQEKLPCGEYRMTDAGKGLGKYTIKVAKSGHTFQNIEWDKSVLDILFSEEEFARVTKIKDDVQAIMN